MEISKDKYTYGILVVKSEGERLLGRPRSRWEDNITRSSGKN
jgi:hypothetical protein